MSYEVQIDVLVQKSLAVLSLIVTQVNKLDPALGQAHLFNEEQNAVTRMEYFVLETMKPETTRTSELNTVDNWNKENLIKMADMLTSLGQPTTRLRRCGWNTSKEGSLRRKTKNKVEEIQLANLASLGSLPSKNQSVAWYACEAPLGKERYVRLNEWKTRRNVC